MNRAIRKVGLAITVLVLILAGQLTYLQVVDADNLANDPRNNRVAIRDFNRPRGQIVSADGQVLATSTPTEGEFEFQREYPSGDLFAHSVGYQSFVFGNSGIERVYNDELVGRDTDLTLDNLGDVLSGKEVTGNVVLTMSQAVQQVARDALGTQRGSVVALNPRTGGIYAMWSNPSYDPQPMAGHNIEDVTDYGEVLAADPNKPDLARAYREIYPNGSSMKPVTATAAIDAGIATPTEPVFPTVTSYTPPQAGAPIENFGGDTCGGNLTQSLVQSCNTTFAELGVALGEQFPPAMQRFGFYQQPPIDLFPNAAASTGPQPGSFANDQPSFAFSGIGQGPVAATPLQMALVAGGIANGGVIMTPHVMDRITNADGERSGGFDQEPWLTATNPSTAAALTTMMVGVVENGTATAAQIPGVTVAGKTGTAQVGDGTVHAWFIAFAPAEDPQVAVAVIVEGGGDLGSDATGGQVAAPIARQVIEAVLAGV